MQILKVAILPAIILFQVSLLPAADYSFAESLYKKGDYERAVSEYRREYFIADEAQQKYYGILRAAESCYLSENYSAVLYELNASQAEGIGQYYSLRTDWLKSFSSAAGGAFLPAINRLESIDHKPSEPAVRYQQLIYRLQQHLALNPTAQPPAELTGSWQQMQPFNLPESEYYSPPLRDTQALGPLLRQWPAADTASPFLAGFMSAVVPGAGQALYGYWGDAVTSLTVVAVFTGGSILAYQNNEIPLAAVAGSAAAAFYAGGIYGAANGAIRLNHEKYRETERKLKELSLNYRLMKYRF